MKLVSLLSGGLDSCVATAFAKHAKHEVVAAVWCGYGQRHFRERANAVVIANHFQLPFVEARLPELRGGLLTTDQPLPEKSTDGVAPTFVPARNAMMLCYAANVAYNLGADGVVIGANAVDYSGYPDCRSEFLNAMAAALSLALGRYGFAVFAPLVMMPKSEIIKVGLELGAPIHLTWSCYAGGQEPCGACDSCRIRSDGFKAAGLSDPALGVSDGD